MLLQKGEHAKVHFANPRMPHVFHNAQWHQPGDQLRHGFALQSHCNRIAMAMFKNVQECSRMFKRCHDISKSLKTHFIPQVPVLLQEQFQCIVDASSCTCKVLCLLWPLRRGTEMLWRDLPFRKPNLKPDKLVSASMIAFYMNIHITNMFTEYNIE